MPEKVPFKTGRIHGFSNRNAADDAEAVWRSHKKKSAKNYSLDRQTTSSQIGEITGVKRNCFLKNLRIVCRFFERRFSVPASESHRSVVLLAPIGEVVAESYPIRTVIQFSICPSIGSQREGSFINPLNNQLGTFLPFARKNFCKLFVNGGYNDKKSQYTAHQISGRKSLAISLMKLCTGSAFQKPSMSAFFRSAGRRCDRSGAAAISFGGCLVFHFRYSVVDSAMRARYSIAYRTLVRQVILTYCSRKSGCRFRQPTLQKLSLINMGFSDSSKNPQYLLQFPPKRLSAVRHPSAAACPKRI